MSRPVLTSVSRETKSEIPHEIAPREQFWPLEIICEVLPSRNIRIGQPTAAATGQLLGAPSRSPGGPPPAGGLSVPRALPVLGDRPRRVLVPQLYKIHFGFC